MAIIVGHSTGQVFVAQTKDQVVKQLEDLSKKAAGAGSTATRGCRPRGQTIAVPITQLDHFSMDNVVTTSLDPNSFIE